MLVFVVAKNMRDGFKMLAAAALRAGCAMAAAKSLSPLHCCCGPAEAVPLLQSSRLSQPLNLVDQPRNVLSRICDEVLVRRSRSEQLNVVTTSIMYARHDEAVPASMISALNKRFPRSWRRRIATSANCFQLC
jgi:hypothetical protein